MKKLFFRKWFSSLLIFFAGTSFASAAALYYMISQGNLLTVFPTPYEKFIVLINNITFWSLIISLVGAGVSSCCYCHDIKEQSLHDQRIEEYLKKIADNYTTKPN